MHAGMHVCMYVYVCTCVHVRVCMHMYVHICMYEMRIQGELRMLTACIVLPGMQLIRGGSNG